MTPALPPAVTSTVLGRVAVLTINRPDVRNAIDAAVSEGLGAALTEAAADDRIGALVVTGSGDRAFCAGMDLKTPPRPSDRPGIGVVLRDRYPKPLIAAVNGAAVGGGFDLALACDLVVAAEHATFGLPEITHGLSSVGGTARLAQRVPRAVTLEFCLTGEPIDAMRALALGLVNRVVPADRVLDEAVGLGELVSSRASAAVAFMRELVDELAGTPDAATWAALQARAPQ